MKQQSVAITPVLCSASVDFQGEKEACHLAPSRSATSRRTVIHNSATGTAPAIQAAGLVTLSVPVLYVPTTLVWVRYVPTTEHPTTVSWCTEPGEMVPPVEPGTCPVLTSFSRLAPGETETASSCDQ